MISWANILINSSIQIANKYIDIFTFGTGLLALIVVVDDLRRRRDKGEGGRGDRGGEEEATGNERLERRGVQTEPSDDEEDDSLSNSTGRWCLRPISEQEEGVGGIK